MSRQNRQNKWRTSSSAASPGMPAPPHLHAGGVSLDDDAGALVWERLRASPATAQRASGVCKEWRQYVLATFEHELDLAGICSEKHLRYAKQPHAEVSDEALFADMTRRLAPFRSLRAIKAHDFSWLNDASLRAIAAAKEGPRSLLTSFDVSGCLGVSSLGVKAPPLTSPHPPPPTPPLTAGAPPSRPSPRQAACAAFGKTRRAATRVARR